MKGACGTALQSVLSKRSCLQANTSGLKPACLEVKYEDHDGLAEQSVSDNHSEPKAAIIAHDVRP